MFREVHVVLPSQDVASSIRFYETLGFVLKFADSQDRPTYAGVRRDNVELHLQWHDPREWSAVERPSLRFLIGNVDGLYREYSEKKIIPGGVEIRNTTWGTREFAFFDPYKNGLTFYQDR